MQLHNLVMCLSMRKAPGWQGALQLPVAGCSHSSDNASGKRLAVCMHLLNIYIYGQGDWCVCRQQLLSLDTVKELLMWAIMCTDLVTLLCRLVVELLRYKLFCFIRPLDCCSCKGPFDMELQLESLQHFLACGCHDRVCCYILCADARCCVCKPCQLCIQAKKSWTESAKQGLASGLTYTQQGLEVVKNKVGGPPGTEGTGGTSYSTGHTATGTAGVQPSYNTSAQTGHSAGAQPGYNTSAQTGHSAGAQPGYNAGSQPGYNTGAESGYNAGSQSEFNNGSQPGHNAGAQPGYNAGTNTNQRY